MSINFTVQLNEEIQTYVDLASAGGGGIVYLLGGTYNLTDNLVIPSSVRIQGVGSGGSIIDFGNLAKQIQIVGTAMAPVDSAFLQGIGVQNSSVALVKVSYTNNFGGEDVKCSNGLVGTSIDNSTILNWSINTIDNCGTGITVDSSSGFTVDNAFISNITSVGAYIFTNSSNGVLINSSLETVKGYGYSFISCGNIGTDQISIVDVDGIGFLLDAITSSFSITNGLISGSTGDALKIQNSSSQIQVSTMQFSDNTGWGVNIADAGSTDNLFVGNTFANNTAGNFSNSGTGTLIRSNIGVLDN